MLNEYAYCPRLFHLEHVEGRWADNRFTVEGKEVHRRVDRFDDTLPDPNEAPELEEGGDAPPEISRSVRLTSEELGISGKPDLVSTAGTRPCRSTRSAGGLRTIRKGAGSPSGSSSWRRAFF
jgi:CRISP-associated protein Cas1